MGTITGMDLKIKYVIRDVDRYGNVRWYYRHPGCKKIVLPSPADPRFFEGLAAAQAKAKPAPKEEAGRDTLRWLCMAYMDSAAYKRELSKSTKDVRKRILDRLCQSHPSKKFKEVDSGWVMEQRDKWSDEGAEAGNSVVKALRQVYKWAKEAKHVDTNPAAEVSYLQADNPDGFHTWTEQEIEQFKTKWPLGTKPYLALMLLMFGGGRRSDAVRLGRQMVKDGCFHYVEWKGRGKKRTRKERSVPIVPVLQEAIDAGPVGEMIYLVTTFNKPFTPDGFGNWFKDRCVEANLHHCSAHGLRKAAACQAAEAGCTEAELMAMFGWSSPKQPALYTKKVNTSKLAQSGMSKIIDMMAVKRKNEQGT